MKKTLQKAGLVLLLSLTGCKPSTESSKMPVKASQPAPNEPVNIEGVVRYEGSGYNQQKVFRTYVIQTPDNLYVAYTEPVLHDIFAIHSDPNPLKVNDRVRLKLGPETDVVNLTNELYIDRKLIKLPPGRLILEYKIK